MRKKFQFASIGDCCVDIYPQYNKEELGGTAFNVAINAAKAGAKVNIFSAVGTDSYGDLFQRALEKRDVDIKHLKKIYGKTSGIYVDIDSNGERSFSNWKLGVLKKYLLSGDDELMLRESSIARVVLFKPMKNLFDQFCNMDLPSTLKVGDFAGSSEYSGKLEDIMQYVNNLNIIVKSLEEPDNSSIDFFKNLSDSYKEKLFLVLLGNKGSIIFASGKIYKQTSSNVISINTNGAGDAYLAAFLICYIETKDIVLAMKKGDTSAQDSIKKIGTIY